MSCNVLYVIDNEISCLEVCTHVSEGVVGFASLKPDPVGLRACILAMDRALRPPIRLPWLTGNRWAFSIQHRERHLHPEPEKDEVSSRLHLPTSTPSSPPNPHPIHDQEPSPSFCCSTTSLAFRTIAISRRLLSCSWQNSAMHTSCTLSSCSAAMPFGGQVALSRFWR